MSNIPQHKRMAMGERVGYKKGGSIAAPKAPMPAAQKPLSTGRRDSPMETVKRANGIPGMKNGGRC